MHAGARLAAVAVVVAAFAALTWLGRYSIVAVPNGLYVLDRWRGEVYHCYHDWHQGTVVCSPAFPAWSAADDLPPGITPPK